MKKSTEDYYKTLAALLKWQPFNYSIYNGYTICAHPEPSMTESPVFPDTIGWCKRGKNIYTMHFAEMGKGQPIWKILMKIDKIDSNNG